MTTKTANLFTFASTAEAAADSYLRQLAAQCDRGRHVNGCQHRPCSPWVMRALHGILPATDRTGSIKVR